jgi:Protein of unknown function (DUF3551)
MKKLFVLAALGTGLLFQAHSASAQQANSYPWCAEQFEAGLDCSFDSFAQCTEYLLGLGGYCTPNPSYAGGRNFGSTRQPRRRNG